jgi:hypothetical protein
MQEVYQGHGDPLAAEKAERAALAERAAAAEKAAADKAAEDAHAKAAAEAEAAAAAAAAAVAAAAAARHHGSASADVYGSSYSSSATPDGNPYVGSDLYSAFGARPPPQQPPQQQQQQQAYYAPPPPIPSAAPARVQPQAQQALVQSHVHGWGAHAPVAAPAHGHPHAHPQAQVHAQAHTQAQGAFQQQLQQQQWQQQMPQQPQGQQASAPEPPAAQYWGQLGAPGAPTLANAEPEAEPIHSHTPISGSAQPRYKPKTLKQWQVCFFSFLFLQLLISH